jgi:hypothetical protein
MLDPRIYRTGLVAVVLAVIVFAFALQGQAGPLSTTLAPYAFNGQNAYRNTVSLAYGYPRRPPGSVQDRALGRVIAARLTSDGYRVRKQWFSAATSAGERRTFNVIAVKQGLSNSAIVIVAHRDALHSAAPAEQSGTGVLLELARLLSGETLNHTLVLASTTGSTGAAGAARLAAGLGRPLDTVIALGDMAGTDLRRPLVIPWSDSTALAPTVLRSTVVAALHSQAGISAGSPSMLGEMAQLAFPYGLTEQAPFNARGIPAVLISTSGSRPVPVNEPISIVRATRMGRSALWAVNALDGSRSIPGPSTYMTLGGKIVPEWVIQLLVLALILPAAATALDGFARARRRGYLVARRFMWIGLGALPFIAVVVIARVLGATGLLNAPAGPVGPGAFPVDGGGIAAMACLGALVMGSFAWLCRRGLLHGLVGRDAAGRTRRQPPAQANGNGVGAANGKQRRESLGDPGGVAATLVLACTLAIVAWFANPFAALLLVPALHLWLVALAPAARIGRVPRAVVLVLGFALPLAVLAYYAVTLGFGPGTLVWTGLLMVAAGQFGLPASLLICLLLGVAISAVVNAAEILKVKIDREPPATPVTVRGPVTYAGPGSLGGTESALSPPALRR